MKKVLALILCLLIVSCSAVTVFANEAPIADGTVLYSATFDGSASAPKSIDDAGLVPCKEQASFNAVVNENVSLTVSQNGGYSNLGF